MEKNSGGHKVDFAAHPFNIDGINTDAAVENLSMVLKDHELRQKYIPVIDMILKVASAISKLTALYMAWKDGGYSKNPVEVLRNIKEKFPAIGRIFDSVSAGETNISGDVVSKDDEAYHIITMSLLYLATHNGDPIVRRFLSEDSDEPIELSTEGEWDGTGDCFDGSTNKEGPFGAILSFTYRSEGYPIRMMDIDIAVGISYVNPLQTVIAINGIGTFRFMQFFDLEKNECCWTRGKKIIMKIKGGVLCIGGRKQPFVIENALNELRKRGAHAYWSRCCIIDTTQAILVWGGIYTYITDLKIRWYEFEVLAFIILHCLQEKDIVGFVITEQSEIVSLTDYCAQSLHQKERIVFGHPNFVKKLMQAIENYQGKII